MNQKVSAALVFLCVVSMNSVACGKLDRSMCDDLLRERIASLKEIGVYIINNETVTGLLPKDCTDPAIKAGWATIIDRRTGKIPRSELSATPKGRSIGGANAHWTVIPFFRAALVETTGIMQEGTSATVTFSWIAEPTEQAREFQNSGGDPVRCSRAERKYPSPQETGTATLKRYDDGWRIEELELYKN